jgi:hypothetical protein
VSGEKHAPANSSAPPATTLRAKSKISPSWVSARSMLPRCCPGYSPWQEQIVYVFDDRGHGVERYIPVRYRYDDTHDRVVDLTDISGSSDSGAPVDLVRRTATISTCASATPTSW